MCVLATRLPFPRCALRRPHARIGGAPSPPDRALCFRATRLTACSPRAPFWQGVDSSEHFDGMGDLASLKKELAGLREKVRSDFDDSGNLGGENISKLAIKNRRVLKGHFAK